MGMKNFRHIDPVSLRAFYFAALTLHFTRASELAGLTQSGVSQHVARLEEELGVDLFLRSGRKVSLTAAGRELLAFAESYVDQVEQVVTRLGGAARELEGPVRYAMPASCLMTPHFPLLLQKRAKFPDVELQVTICHSEEVLERLVAGEIDFGFITRTLGHKDVERTEFAREEYVLVGADKAAMARGARELLEERFIDYPGMDVLFEAWHRDVLPRRVPPALRELTSGGRINDLAAAVTMVEHGVGLGVFPRHCVQAAIQRRTLYPFGGSTGATYPIYLVRPRGSRPLARVDRVVQAFWEMKRG